MSRIRLEWVPIQVYHLGILGLDHLQITYEPTGSGGQDDWFVMEGAKGGFYLGAFGSDGRTTLPMANVSSTGPRYGQDLIDAIGTPATRGSRALPVVDTFTAWETMAVHAQDIEEQFAYSALGIPGTVIPSLNSSSLVASLLYYADVHIANHIPYGMRRTSGTHTLLGTQSDDELVTDDNFSTLASGQGNDTLHGTDASERFYGGMGNDLIHWNKGYNLYHGGQYKMSYADDGTDTVDYSGGGVINIQRSFFRVENAAPDYVVRVSGGAIDHLYSIERIQWSTSSDTLQLEDVEVLEDGLLIQMGLQDSPQGDRVELAAIQQGLLINPTGVSGQLYVHALNEADQSRASWIDSAETIVATSGGDMIFLADTVHVVEGGAGDDLIDSRLSAAFSAASPQGYDAEIAGGTGSDTLVAGSGRVLLDGGAGADTFVVSSMTSTASRVEIVVTGADTSDRLYVPYALFDGTGGAYEGSELMPVLGGIGQPGIAGGGIYAYFDWRTEMQSWTSLDLTQGIITFVGDILFDMDGADLLIHLFQGVPQTYTYDNGQQIVTYTDVLPLPQTETIVRVKGFQDGQLGIHFYDPGEPVTQPGPGGGLVFHYPNYDSIVHTLTADGARHAPLDPRPASVAAPAPENAPPPARVAGTAGDDIIALADLNYRVDTAAGNDAVTAGAGRDLIDGGAGADTMAGGAGNDSYIVDQAGDSVVEAAAGGTDLVYASASYTLSADVENLSLVGDAAISATGNAAANSIGGNEADNILSGGGGDDLLAGSAGRDTMIGGAGNDRYGYNLGDGEDVISDLGAAGDLDVLLINEGVAASAISFARANGAPQDLLLLIDGGGRITLKDFGTSSALSVDEVMLADGTHWTRAALTAFLNAAPAEGNSAPSAVDDLFGVDMATVTLPSSLLLANDSDRNGDTLTIVQVSEALNSVVSLTAAGDIVVETPVGTQIGASFKYTVSDGHGGTATAYVDLGTFTVGQPGVIAGTSGADSLPGSAEAETLNGNAGDDTLEGGAGADLIDGGSGSDWASYAAALEGITLYLDGSSASTGDAAGDVFLSIEGILGSNLPDAILGTASAEQMRGGGGGDYFYGQGGNDTLAGEAGMDGLTGGSGDDVLIGGSDVDNLDGGAGNDLLDALADETDGAPDELIGGDGDDTFIVGSGDNVYESASGGLDTVIARASYTLAAGVEVEYLEADSAAVTQLVGNEYAQTVANKVGSSAALYGGGGADGLVGTVAAELIYGDFGDIAGIGIASADSVNAGGGNDTVYGEAGFDVLLGQDGDDLISGGDDNDSLDGGAGADTLNGDLGHDSMTGGDGGDSMVGQAGNDLEYGQAGNDQLVGGWNHDTLVGGQGADTLTGNDGNDRLDGVTEESTATRDTLDGGAGNDTYIVQGDDVVIEAAGNGTDVLMAATSFTLALGLSIETVLAHANGITAGGNDLDQTLGFTSAVTTTAQLRGGGGADTITGGNGSDTLWGDFAGGAASGVAGNDSIYGGSGGDTINGESGNDTIDAGSGYDLVYGEAGNDSLLGGDGFDTIYAGSGNDSLLGGNGDDVLWGESGSDILTGGAGNDRYAFRAGFGRDTITDRATGEIIDVQGFGATYANLVFTLTAAGLEISSLKFGAGNVIVLEGTTAIPGSGQFLF